MVFSYNHHQLLCVQRWFRGPLHPFPDLFISPSVLIRFRLGSMTLRGFCGRVVLGFNSSLLLSFRPPGVLYLPSICPFLTFVCWRIPSFVLRYRSDMFASFCPFSSCHFYKGPFFTKDWGFKANKCVHITHYRQKGSKSIKNTNWNKYKG